jgi:hypothetical protein
MIRAILLALTLRFTAGSCRPPYGLALSASANRQSCRLVALGAAFAASKNRFLRFLSNPLSPSAACLHSPQRARAGCIFEWLLHVDDVHRQHRT